MILKKKKRCVGLSEFGKFFIGRRSNMKREFSNQELLDPKNTLLLALDTLCVCSEETEAFIDEESVIFPQYELRVRPYVEKVAENMVVLDFWTTSPRWNEAFFECSVGAGGDTNTAIGMSMGAFMFGFLKTAMNMNAEVNFQEITSNYVTKKHSWKMYKSDLIGMGDLKEVQSETDIYWNMLKNDIIARLGNHKNYYIKIYGSKYKDDVTGEVRINDIVSEELSNKVADFVRTWSNEEFASQKQFFFFAQDEETITNDPYCGGNGYKLLKDKVKQAIDIYMELMDKEDFDYDEIYPAIKDALGDDTLAFECFYFLPEICTENAFGDKFKVPEYVLFHYPDKDSDKIYKSQLSNYNRIGNALFDLFNEGVFGEKTNDIYKTLIGNSSVAKGLSAAMEGGSDTRNCEVCTSYFYQDAYIFR